VVAPKKIKEKREERKREEKERKYVFGSAYLNI
jgi:hypothetical protein